MSRAFISESDSDFDEADVPQLKIPLPPGSKNYMTAEGAQKIDSELYRLLHEERPKLAAGLSRQVAGSDSTDRETQSRQRRRLREIDRRIEYLTAMMGRLEVVDSRGQDHERVAFGATVTVSEGRGRNKVYRIVGVDESDLESGRISWISPLSRSLIGARVGDVVTVQLPEDRLQLTVLKIEYNRG